MRKALLIASIISVLFLTGCNNKSYDVSEDDFKDCRFSIDYKQDFGSYGFATVVTDKETGERYLFVNKGYGAGLCHLEESE